MAEGALRSLALSVVACLLFGALPIPAGAQQPECVTIDDFAKGKVGEFPTDWKPRKDSGKDVYKVLEEKGLRFLRAASKGLGIQAAKQFEWDLGAYPMLAWSWRPREFPKGADERDSGANDSALAVYLFVPYSRITGPKAMKYIWSEKVPAGTHLNSNYGLTQVLVLRSGGPARDEWTEERVNALADYKKFFGESDTPKPFGIGVLTDSDDTKSSAQGDYASFRACRG
ncbi:MAG: DUF3047 domain-containing protein [Candidatus Rokuibacteriota bacterium]